LKTSSNQSNSIWCLRLGLFIWRSVSLATIDQANEAFCLRAGQLLVEIVSQANHQRPFPLTGDGQTGQVILPSSPAKL
jgi:hypothetical protein